jgi:hypothetical protein
MKGTLLLRPKHHSSISPLVLLEVTEVCNTALIAHALHAMELSLKSLCNEGILTLEDQKIFSSVSRHTLLGVARNMKPVIFAYELRTVQVWLNKVSNEGHFTRGRHSSSSLSSLALQFGD